MEKMLYLKAQNGKFFHVNFEYLKPYQDILLEFLDDIDYMKTFDFARENLFNEEIKFNNNIEGINDGIELIDKVIEQLQVSNNSTLQRRIINLYTGYKYILNNRAINKETLKELYDILSDGLLDDSDKCNMGKYYRNGTVYILKGGHLAQPYMGEHLEECVNNNPFLGVDVSKIDQLMNLFFEYVNDNDAKNEIEIFIKSQIMHFYFVYIHPYFDVNGRTSRTISIWYLLNNQVYPYTIFNRAIAFSEKDYCHNIIKAKSNYNMTLFLKYMLVSVLVALERVYLVHNIKDNASLYMTKEELLILECFLSLKGELTVKDLAIVYNNYNNFQRVKDIYMNKILPLIEKGILLDLGKTKSNIANDMPNVRLAINSKNIDVDSNKVKHLKLSKYIR